jgi:hypothetical protein
VAVVALLCASAGAGAACSGTRAIAAAALPKIVLGAADAPAGTAFAPDLSGSGPTTFAADLDERQKLTTLGVTATQLATFSTPGLSAAPDPAKLPPGARIVVSFGATFPTAAAAGDAFAFYRDDFYPRSLQSAARASAPKLGDDATAFTFDATADVPFPGEVYLWRRGNGLFGLLTSKAQGGIDDTEARALAAKMDARV